MQIETKLTINNMKKNLKRTIFTTLSIILGTVLIFVTMLLISSIKNGIAENVETQYNDYHFIIKNINEDSFNKIKDKEYIEKIYIQENESKQLKELERPFTFNTSSNINVYIKYKNIKNVCNYSTDIIQTLNLSKEEINATENKFAFNQRLLTIYGLIDVTINDIENRVVARVNYSYVIDILITFILVAFSVLFIIILYNAFLITINERKKEYAILNSVGATESQILKMILLEAIIMGIIGIIMGGIISVISTNIILNSLNKILIDTGCNFRLIVDIKYLILSLCIIAINIYLSSLIPSIKASTTSVIQGIRNNKEIKYKKRKTILEKILPVEGKMAIKNIRRNKNKYRVITILLVVCMTSYITVSTYINYEKATSELVNEYDVDAELKFYSESNIDYKTILNNYEKMHGNKIEYDEYKVTGPYILVKPKEAIITDVLVTTHDDYEKSMPMALVGLDDKTYTSYINKLNANYGDIIIYNNVTVTEIYGEKNIKYKYSTALKTGYNLELSIITSIFDYEKDKWGYEIIDDKNLDDNIILTDELIEGYKELKTKYYQPTIFVNMEKYCKIADVLKNYEVSKWLWNDQNATSIKIKCSNIIEFSNYIENINEKQNLGIYAEYYSLENQEKIIYINVIQLILKVIIIAIITIGIISTINIINSSLCEREQDFKILHSLGATKSNINKILIYECVYTFIKATIISIILSIPILYGIIKYMGNIISMDKLLIPFGNIIIFFTIILIISITITLYSTKFIKNE